MFDLKDAEIKDEEAEMILQNRKDVIVYPDYSKIWSVKTKWWLPAK